MPTKRKTAIGASKTRPVQEDDEQVDDLDEAEEVIPFTYSITSYGADYPVDSLVKRIEAKDIVVPVFNWKKPKETDILGFQRDYVWPRSKADRFIESLLLGLPCSRRVPGQRTLGHSSCA